MNIFFIPSPILFRITYIFQPLGYHRVAVGCLGRTDPEARRQEVPVGNQPLGVRLHAADAATRTRYDQTDALADHLRTMVEQEVCKGAAMLLHQSGAATMMVPYCPNSTSTGSIAG